MWLRTWKERSGCIAGSGQWTKVRSVGIVWMLSLLLINLHSRLGLRRTNSFTSRARVVSKANTWRKSTCSMLASGQRLVRRKSLRTPRCSSSRQWMDLTYVSLPMDKLALEKLTLLQVPQTRWTVSCQGLSVKCLRSSKEWRKMAIIKSSSSVTW